jgi:hypothetical protein
MIPRERREMKNVYKVVSSAALAAMLLGGLALSNPVTAAESKASSGSSQQSASKKASATHSGITLQASNAIYDGNYISIKIQRSGKGYKGKITGGRYDEKTEEYIYDKGAMSDTDIYVDGKPIYEYGGGKSPAQRPSLVISPGPDADTAYIRMSDASLLGGNHKAFPDKMKITAQISLEGVKEPYMLEIPVQKSSDKAVVLKPEQTKKSGNLSMTLKQVRATSASTRLQWVLKGKDVDLMNRLQYNFVDDQGRKLDFISGRGTDENNKNGDFYFDFILRALEPDVKSITIKPYTAEFEDPGAKSGPHKVDSNGETIKNYVKDLEMTIPVK